jgi:hypothetical protein
MVLADITTAAATVTSVQNAPPPPPPVIVPGGQISILPPANVQVQNGFSHVTINIH